MRLQLALNVRNIDEAVDYYGKLFGATPHKRRPGYANFAIDAPPLKLVLMENPGAADRLNHLGVEVFDDALVRAAGRRLDEADILESMEEETVCCHATQTKVWSHEPQGLRWEWYTVTDDTPDGQALVAPEAGEDGATGSGAKTARNAGEANPDTKATGETGAGCETEACCA